VERGDNRTPFWPIAALLTSAARTSIDGPPQAVMGAADVVSSHGREAAPAPKISDTRNAWSGFYVPSLPAD
jgi:hypothetical protein